MATLPGPVGIDQQRVARWLAGHVDGLTGPVEFALISGGRSNLTYRVTDAEGRMYALRRPPTGGVLATAHDMHREWRFLTALAPTAVPVAPPLAFCADPAVAGAEFYIMGFIDGHVLADREAALALAPPARARAADHLIDVLVALHGFDPAGVGLGDFVRRTGYLERQLRRWHSQVHTSLSMLVSPELRSSSSAALPPRHLVQEQIAVLDEVHDLLIAQAPPQSTGIVHGDYRPGNMAFGPDGTVRAVFDWELATTGDPMADLGWLASSWMDPGETTEATTEGPSTAPGFPRRADLVNRYARLSGRDVSRLPYWVAFSRWRSACIAAGVQARYLAGHMADDGYLEQARARAEQGMRLAQAAREALRAPGV